MVGIADRLTARSRREQQVSGSMRYRDRFDTLQEAERLARRRLPRAMFSRLSNGVDGGVTARANVDAFGRVWFRTRGASARPDRTTWTTVAGTDIALPVVLAPVGALRLQHPDGVLAAMTGARAGGTICAISPGCGHPIEEILAAADSPIWYQVTTAIGGRDAAEADIEKLGSPMVHALVVTVDSVLRPKAAPIRLSPRSAVEFGPDLARHPRWTVGFVRDGMRLSVANAALGSGMASAARPVRWDDFGWIRPQWSGPLVVKGIMCADDARTAVDAGADVVVVSNHGGLTLDGTAPTLRALPDVLAAVDGRAEVLVDGGVRSGGDVVKAVAMGAGAVLVGRPYVMGLAVAGAAGVARILEIMREDVDRALAFLGCTSIADLDPSHIDVA